ncbi:hypothetical protein ACVQK1_06880 [Edwardsiella tarda]
MSYAPVVLFVHARLSHTKKTIESLCNNHLASDTILYIYSDAARNNDEINKVNCVREYIKKTTGFKKLIIIERKENYGLAKNIIDGVNSIIKKHGRVIVLEDDLITSSDFLYFMNSALNKYKYEKQVWHISGWNYPLAAQFIDSETFFWRTMNCWGWATWEDRWCFFEKDPIFLIEHWSKKEINRFNLDGTYNFWSQVIANSEGKLNTWAVFWYASIFLKKGLCLNPTQSFVMNIGHDGSGENCGIDDVYKSKLSEKFNGGWPKDIIENKDAVDLIKAFYRSLQPSIFYRLVRKIKKTLL